MSTNWDTFENRLAVNGSSNRDRLIQKLKNDINNKLVNSPSYRNVLIDGEEQSLSIIDDTKPNLKKIYSLPDESFLSGSYVIYKNKTWLIIESDYGDELYVDGKMKQCNVVLRWQDSTNKIIERWAIAESPLSQGLDEQKFLTTPDLVYKVHLPLDGDTKNLQRGKRFLLDINGILGNPDAFIMSQRDVLTGMDNQEGIMAISLTQDAFNKDTDNGVLMIANYTELIIAPVPLEVIPSINAEITYLNKPIVKMGGSYKRFNAFFKDNQGVILNNVIPNWTWTIEDNLIDKFTVNMTDNYFEIKALYDTELIGKALTITLTDSDITCSAELIVEVGDL